MYLDDYPRRPDGSLDLSGAGLTGANLEGANLRYANLDGADLSGATLRGATLRGADLKNTVLKGADLTYTDLADVRLTGANLTGANLTGAVLTRAVLAGVDLTGVDLTRARGYSYPDAPDPGALRAAVAAQIRAQPDLHDQRDWGDGDPSECGTPCCVAGWACRLGGGTRGDTVATAATRLLWLDDAPMPSFAIDASREDILAALEA